MLIEHTIHREGGSIHRIDGVEYHFKPIDTGAFETPHVCDVSNPRHIKRFLSIPDFEVFDASGGDPVERDEENDEEPTDIPPSRRTNGRPVRLSEPGREEVAVPEGDGGEEDDYAGLSLDELRDMHEAVTGRMPHWRAGRDRIIATIEKHQDSEG